MVHTRGGNVDVGVCDVCVAWEEGWDLGPVEEVGGVSETELRGDVVVTGVRDVESAIDTHYTWVLGATDCLVVFGSVGDGSVETGEASAISGPS